MHVIDVSLQELKLCCAFIIFLLPFENQNDINVTRLCLTDNVCHRKMAYPSRSSSISCVVATENRVVTVHIYPIVDCRDI